MFAVIVAGPRREIQFAARLQHTDLSTRGFAKGDVKQTGMNTRDEIPGDEGQDARRGMKYVEHSA